jgi:hypothetical protein
MPPSILLFPLFSQHTTPPALIRNTGASNTYCIVREFDVFGLRTLIAATMKRLLVLSSVCIEYSIPLYTHAQPHFLVIQVIHFHPTHHFVWRERFLSPHSAHPPMLTWLLLVVVVIVV